MTDRANKRIEPGQVTASDDQAALLRKDIHDEIGRQLRKVYGGVLAEPLPERLRKLLDKLSKSE